MSLADVPAGHLAAVVTCLEMRLPPAPLPATESALTLDQVTLAPEAYRNLFRAVGGPWLWFSRLIISDADLGAILDRPEVTLYEVRDGHRVVGMLELDRRLAGECELSFVGLIPSYAGKGHGRWLLDEAVRRAWEGAERIHVHTCSLDHPAALAAYLRAGFTATGRKVEIFSDPRLVGILSRDAAPQVPLIDRGPD